MSIRYSLSHPRLPTNVFRFYNTTASLQRFLKYTTDPTTNRPIATYGTVTNVRCYYELSQSGFGQSDQELRRSDGTLVAKVYNFMFEGKISLDTRDKLSVDNVEFNIIMSNFDPTNRFTFAIAERVQPSGNPI